MIDGNIDLVLWDKKYNVKIIYDCYKDESVLPEQKEALSVFLNSIYRVNEVEKKIIKYFQENGYKAGSIHDYLIPQSIYVCRELNKRKVAILCESFTEVEHGIAIVFENEKLSEIGTQDLVL